MEKIYNDPEIGKVTFVKKPRTRRIGIKVHPVKGVSVNVPWLVPYSAALSFFLSKRDRVLSVMKLQRQKYESVKDITPRRIEEMRAEARAQLPARLAVLAGRYGFEYGRVTVRHNVSNWGSCSSRGNISLNLNLVRLPSVLRDYVMLHELCHLRHLDHGPAFHQLLERLCADNVLQLASEGDEDALRIAREAAASRSRYPFHKMMTASIKRYPLV